MSLLATAFNRLSGGAAKERIKADRPAQEDVGHRDLEAPLLGDAATPTAAPDTPPEDDGTAPSGDIDLDPAPDLQKGVQLRYATAALAAAITSAGLMAVPRVLHIYGLLLGGGLTAFVFCLSALSLWALQTAASHEHQPTYTSLAESHFGAAGAAALQAAVVLSNCGAMAAYLIVIADMLCGVAPAYDGLVTNLLGVHDGSAFYTSRAVVMAAVCVLILGPVLSRREPFHLPHMSLLAQATVGVFVAGLLGLTVVGAVRGQLAEVHWLPTPKALHSTSTHFAIKMLATLPTISMSLASHYNLLPVASSFERFTEGPTVVAVHSMLAACTLLFTAASLGSVLLFGSNLKADILLNLTPEALAVFLPAGTATALSAVLRICYCTALLSIIVIMNWAACTKLSVAMFESPLEALPHRTSLCLGYSVLAGAYAVSILLPSVWIVMGLSGATAAVMVAYIVPGLLIVEVDGRRSTWAKALGYSFVGVGVTLCIAGVVNMLSLEESGESTASDPEVFAIFIANAMALGAAGVLCGRLLEYVVADRAVPMRLLVNALFLWTMFMTLPWRLISNLQNTLPGAVFCAAFFNSQRWDAPLVGF